MSKRLSVDDADSFLPIEALASAKHLGFSVFKKIRPAFSVAISVAQQSICQGSVPNAAIVD